MKCPYCKGKNLYLKRTSPMEVYGCRDCEKEKQYLKECGLSDDQIKTLDLPERMGRFAKVISLREGIQ